VRQRRILELLIGAGVLLAVIRLFMIAPYKEVALIGTVVCLLFVVLIVLERRGERRGSSNADGRRPK
jgi:hypothetical protein